MTTQVSTTSKSQKGEHASHGFSVFHHTNSNAPSTSIPESYAGRADNVSFQDLQFYWMVGLVNSRKLSAGGRP